MKAQSQFLFGLNVCFCLPQALLSSEPKSSSCGLLKMTMRELIALAMPSIDRNTDSSTVPQV